MAVAFTHELWLKPDIDKFTKISKRLNEQQELFDFSAKKRCFSQWRSEAELLTRAKEERDTMQQFIDTMKNSSRGHRSTMEKEVIRRFIVANLNCIPKTINMSEMDALCNELDFVRHIGRQILFLQGDFGNVYYMIAKGTVGLYLEPSKDREMTIARQFGNLRGQPYNGTNLELEKLGINILNLPAGSGFGEYAILASTNKIRSCACVAMDPDSMLLIMHAETYNKVLRQHHYRQKQLSSATALLQELPLFRDYNYSRIASIAYTMKSQTYSTGSTIVSFGQVINNVLLVASGQVKVYAAPNSDDSDKSPVNMVIKKRIPKLAVAIWGRGQMIGESEVQKGLRTFQMTYEATGASVELLEMPATVFKEHMTSNDPRIMSMHRDLEDLNDMKEQKRERRISRAYDAVKTMMGGETKEISTKGELTNLLPILLSPSSTGRSLSDSPSSSGTFRKVRTDSFGTTTDNAAGVRRPVARAQSFGSGTGRGILRGSINAEKDQIARVAEKVTAAMNVTPNGETLQPSPPGASRRSMYGPPRRTLSFGKSN